MQTSNWENTDLKEIESSCDSQRFLTGFLASSEFKVLLCSRLVAHWKSKISEFSGLIRMSDRPIQSRWISERAHSTSQIAWQIIKSSKEFFANFFINSWRLVWLQVYATRTKAHQFPVEFHFGGSKSSESVIADWQSFTWVTKLRKQRWPRWTFARQRVWSERWEGGVNWMDRMKWMEVQSLNWTEIKLNWTGRSELDGPNRIK